MIVPCIPPSQGKSGLDLYFAMARGAEGAIALDMSKFMDTNYHYEVGSSLQCISSRYANSLV